MERVGDCHGGLKIRGRWFGFLEFHFRENYEKYIISANIYFDKKNKKHMEKDILYIDPYPTFVQCETCLIRRLNLLKDQ